MIEVSVFTVVIARPDAASVVVLTQKGAAASMLGVSSMSDAFNTAGGQVSPSHSSSSQPGGFEDDPLLLPIWIGFGEAEAIMNLLEDRTRVRPLTHDLLASVIGALGSRVERVVIDRVQGSTFFASVCLNRDGRTITIDARPSDSIALALRTGARIFVDEDVMNAAACQFLVKVDDVGELISSSEEEAARFNAFIESISPEDFSL